MRVSNYRAIMVRAPAIIAALAVGALTNTAAAQDDYADGFTWHRMTDYVPGAVHGSTVNNPGPDQLGNPTWEYTWTAGGPVGEPDAWYKNDGTLMLWDEAWFDHGHGVWARGDDISPPIFNDRTCHHISSDNCDCIPIVKWLNPVDTESPSVIGIEGSLMILWTGEFGIGSAVDVDVVVVFNDHSEGTTTLLVFERVSKPTPGDSVGETVVVDVDLPGVLFDTDDSLTISHRAMEPIDGRWIPMFDNLTFTLGVVCAADFNGDFVVNTLDFLLYLNAFNNRDPRADFNEDGNIDTLDVLAFLNAFNAGC